jgi:dihydroorotate dehydrogenase
MRAAGGPGLYANAVRTAERLGARALLALPSEASRDIAVKGFALAPYYASGALRASPPALGQSLFGLAFPNPVGLAAGLDKDAEFIDGVAARGFGFVEVGTVTPRPQPGNPKPRVWKIPAEGAVINRFGFNSEGRDAVLARLRARRTRLPVGLNIGANRDSADRIADYCGLFRDGFAFADYITVNISSPNTPGLRDLQGADMFTGLLGRISEVRGAVDPARRKPVFVKISPDLDLAALDRIVAACLAHDIDALIVSNTTTDRPARLSPTDRDHPGGLSGRPLFAKSTWLLAQAALRTEGRIRLIGVGGIDSGEAAWMKIAAGASLVQLYTALIYNGPALLDDIKAHLVARLAERGLSEIGSAVGCDIAGVLSATADFERAG